MTFSPLPLQSSPNECISLNAQSKKCDRCICVVGNYAVSRLIENNFAVDKFAVCDIALNCSMDKSVADKLVVIKSVVIKSVVIKSAVNKPVANNPTTILV